MAEHMISLAETSAERIAHILARAFELRDERHRGRLHAPILRGRTLAMLFEKPSLRTRVSFEQAMNELGGHAIVLGQHEVGLGQRESVADVTRVLCGMVHGIAARVFEHAKLEEMARHSSVPVINMLSDYSHPCQALADLMTILDEFAPGSWGDGPIGGAAPLERFRGLRGRTVAFIGDGNNVARSLAILCGKFGLNFILASPPGYQLEAEFVDRIMAQVPEMEFELVTDPKEAARRADVLVTDTFVSMGQEEEKESRLRAFRGYQINADLLAAAPDHAIVLHCLPAYRGIEITDEVMDGPRSRVFQEAHNRLHAQKGLLAVLMGEPA